MIKLEYRLNDEFGGFPSLFYYENIDPFELACRLACEYYVMNGFTYHVTSTAYEPNGLSVIYVDKEKIDERFFDEKVYSDVTVEVREFVSRNNAPLIHTFTFKNHAEALRYLQSDYVYIPNPPINAIFSEIQLDSLEVDESRKTYIYYGTKTTLQLNQFGEPVTY